MNSRTIKTRTSSAYPPKTETVVIRVTLSRHDYDTARALGGGYATHGIRAALNLTMKRVKGTANV